MTEMLILATSLNQISLPYDKNTCSGARPLQSLAWDWEGARLATTCKDKKVRVFDVRTGATLQVPIAGQP